VEEDAVALLPHLGGEAVLAGLAGGEGEVPIVTVQEMCEVPVTWRPVNRFTGSRTWLTWPPPDQVIAMSTTPVPTGAPWVSELRKSRKSGILKFSSAHAARPLPGATLSDRPGTRVVQNSPLAAMPGLKS
jgi:hypothetical protein